MRIIKEGKNTALNFEVEFTCSVCEAIFMTESKSDFDYKSADYRDEFPTWSVTCPSCNKGVIICDAKTFGSHTRHV